MLIKTFKSDNSVAVRIPKDFAIPEGIEVELERTGEAVTITLAHNAESDKARMLKWLDELAAMPKPREIRKRDPIMFPKRRGL